jgi:hypothetical protein
MQPFGTPVVPDVNAMIATSSAAVSTGSNEPDVARQGAGHDRVRHLRLLDHLRDLAGAQQRHRGHHDPAREQDAEPRRDRLRRVGGVQQDPRPGLDLQRGGDRLRPRAQLVVAPTARDRRAVVGQQLDGRVDPFRPVEQQQIGPLVGGR